MHIVIPKKIEQSNPTRKVTGKCRVYLRLRKKIGPNFTLHDVLLWLSSSISGLIMPEAEGINGSPKARDAQLHD